MSAPVQRSSRRLVHTRPGGGASTLNPSLPDSWFFILSELLLHSGARYLKESRIRLLKHLLSQIHKLRSIFLFSIHQLNTKWEIDC